MNDNGSRSSPSLLMGDFRVLLHNVRVFVVKVLNDVHLMSNGSSCWWLITSDHDNLDACASAFLDRVVYSESGRVIEGDNANEAQVMHGEESRCVLPVCIGAPLLPALCVKRVGVSWVEFRV